MFVMKCLAHVLTNPQNAGLMAVKLENEKVDTEVTRKNMKHCITWKTITEWGKGFGDSIEAFGTAFKEDYCICQNSFSLSHTYMAQWKTSLIK